MAIGTAQQLNRTCSHSTGKLGVFVQREMQAINPAMSDELSKKIIIYTSTVVHSCCHQHSTL